MVTNISVGNYSLSVLNITTALRFIAAQPVSQCFKISPVSL